MQLKTITTTGKQGTLTVSDAVFGATVNKTLVTQAVRVYMANERQGTSKVKTRGEINRTKKKVYKQKGTGGARHGAKSAPIFVGGGVAHGPKGNQNWSLSLPQKQKHQALISALSWQNEVIQVAEGFEKVSGKTSEVAQMLAQVAPDAKTITVVVPQGSAQVRQACRNIANVCVISARELTAYDVVKAHAIIMTAETVKILEEKLDKKSKSEEKVAEEKKVAPKKATPKAAIKTEAKKTTKK
jgi:large subunit ribosomal protein L4